MAGDSWQARTYGAAMKEGVPYIQLKLDVPDAIELGAFVGAFTSAANEFDRFMRLHRPDVAAEARLYVGEVRQGSIIAHLVPFMSLLPDTVNAMSSVLTLEEFVKVYGRRLGFFKDKSEPPEGITKKELQDFGKQVEAIAGIPNSTLTMAAIEIEDGDHKVRAAFQFNTNEGRSIQDNLASAKRILDHHHRADRERVLMTFVRSDIRGAKVGKLSGELVQIFEIHEKPCALIYGSALAEQEIKQEISNDESVYRKGFVVDVNVQRRGDKLLAYTVTNLHQIIELPDEED
jgi:hypothetical protein